MYTQKLLHKKLHRLVWINAFNGRIRYDSIGAYQVRRSARVGIEMYVHSIAKPSRYRRCIRIESRKIIIV